MRPLPGRPYCMSHDPEQHAARQESRRRGGYGKSNKARLAKSIQVADLTASDTLRVLSGYYLRLAADDAADRATGATLALMARAILEAVRVTDLEAQVVELQRVIADLSQAISDRDRMTG